MNILYNKKYIQKVCGVVYRQIIKKENIDIFKMADDLRTYEYIFGFLKKSFGHDYGGTDFLYACTYVNIQKWGDKILTIDPEQITIVPKQEFKAQSTHYAQVRVDEFYSNNTYMDIMLEYDIRMFDIDPYDEEQDTTDTWDWTIKVGVDKDFNW